MDYTTLYGFEPFEGIKGFDTPTIRLDDADGPSLADLDGDCELSVDLNQLIEQSLSENIAGASPSQLFPELLSSVTSSDTFGSQPEQSPATTVIGEIKAVESMPHIVELQTDENGQTILFLKSGEEEEEECMVEETSGASPIEIEPEFFEDTNSVYSSPAASPAPSSSGRRSSYKAKSRRRQVEKGTEEYVHKRERNNVAVRKSRDKAKVRQQETEIKVKSLTTQNTQLQKKVDLLSKELNVLKGLFTNVGACLPKEYQQYMARAIKAEAHK